MGTPGDKKEISKVVKREIQQPVEQEQPSFPAPTSNLPLQQPVPGTSSEMGVIERQRVSHLESIIGPPLGHPLTGKPVAFQQSLPATIEHYFTQAKYPTSFSPSATIRPKTFLSSVDQPGPSGLQTPKTRPTTASHRLKKTRKPSPEQTPLKKVYTCQICQKDFSTLEKLNKHHQQSHVSSPFKCEHCKKVFSSKFKLVRHALIHSDRKPFCCTVCDRTFHRKDHLKNHIKVHSPQKEVYTCEKENCKKQYTSLLSYRKHLAVHAAEEGNLECQICSEHFETKEQILYHLKVHAGSRTVKNPSEKKFNCDYCGRKFFTKKDVRRHLVVHTGMRDFLCQFCPQRFGRKDHLVRHIKKSHHAQYKSPEETLTTATIKKETTEATKAEFLPVKTEIKTEHPEYQETSTEFPESGTQFPTSGPAYVEPSTGFPVGTVGQAEVYNPEFGLFFEEELPSYFEQAAPSLLLPSTSEQVELKDLGGGLFEEEIPVPTSGSPILMPSESIEATTGSLEVVLNDPELLQRLLEPSEDKNLPLPGFSQTFQSPPGPPPQPPPGS